MVVLALARHLVQIERRVRWFNAEDFDIQHLDPNISHRENITLLHRRGILPPLPEEPSREDLARRTVEQYEELLRLGLIPKTTPRISPRDEFGNRMEMVKETPLQRSIGKQGST